MEKVTLFFVSILILTVSGVILINPKGVESTQVGEKAVFEFRAYTFYNIDETGVGEYLVSDSGFHYGDRDEVYAITYYKRSEKGIDRLESTRASLYPEYSDFNGSVTYTQEKGYKLISKDVRYNGANGLIVGERPFFVTSEEGNLSGSRFEFDVKKRILKAENIRSSFIYE